MVNFSLKHLLFFLLINFIFSLSAFSQTGKIAGVVRDSSSLVPVENVTIFLDGYGDLRETDTSGYFTFDKLSTGSYKITISYMGTDISIDDIKVVDKKTTYIESYVKGVVEMDEIGIDIIKKPVT